VRIGSWQIAGPAPMALGTEAAGTVVAVGSGVAQLRAGDEVMTHPLPLRRHGTWAGRVLAPAATVAARPPAVSWEASAAFPIPALTAAQALDEAVGIESGGWVVVNGAGGVTGGLLVQLAAARGACVIATASAKKAERVRGYGAAELLARGTLSVPIASVPPLEEAAQALREAVEGADGAIVLSLRT